MKVALVVGSSTDLPLMREAQELLKRLGIEHELRVISAHRRPEELFRYARELERRGVEVVIAAAGGAAHLPGMLAALTWLPVVGVPLEGWSLSGLDSLLSMVQMPSGVPVATVSIGRPGARNAVWLAARILALKHPQVRERLEQVWRSVYEGEEGQPGGS